MKKKTIERMALTLREQEAELEAAANARPLSSLLSWLVPVRLSIVSALSGCRWRTGSGRLRLRSRSAS